MFRCILGLFAILLLLSCDNGKIRVGSNEFDSVQKFINGKAIATINYRKGVIDKNGKELIPITYDYVNYAYNNFFVVSKGNKWGLLNSRNKIVIPIKYSYLEYLNDIYFSFSEDGLSGVIDINNNVIMPAVTDHVHGVYDDKYIFATATTKDDDYRFHSAVFKFNSKLLTDAKYSSVESYHNDIFVLGYINSDYDSPKYYDIYDARNNVIITKKLDLFGINKVLRYGNTKDKFLIEGFDHNHVYGIISSDGTSIVEFGILDDIDYLDDDLIAVYKKEYGHGIIDGGGNLITNMVFDSIGKYNNNRLHVRLKNKEFYINKNGVCLENCPSSKWLSYHNINDLRFDHDSYNNIVSLGVQSGRSGDYLKSIDYFDQALELNPLNIDINLDKAISYYMYGYYNKSNEFVNLFLKYSPFNYDALILKGNILMQKNEHLAAALAFKDAIEVDQDRIEGYLKTSIAYGKYGSKYESCRYLKLACSKGSSDGCYGYENFCE